MSNMPLSSHPPISDKDVHTVSALVEMDQIFMIHELAWKTGLAPSTVLHILKDCLRMKKITSKWVSHEERSSYGETWTRSYKSKV